MLKIIFNVVKKVIFAIFLLYGLNITLNVLNVVIPINYISIFFVSLFDIPGLISLIVLYFVL
ncbi:MAG: pro-sigmaK processing inhibitor BofA family protein [Bacilli bacterium]|nr:pro-sigmaK processing inhibitor BofA family protein [Bacilli bacterium]